MAGYMSNNILQYKEKRIELYKKLEEERKSKLLVYITGDRNGWGTRIAEDAADYIAEHLDIIGPVNKISLFLYTTGGSTLAGWNIVNLIRQFCKELEIIVPNKARSTGTLMCLGADNIIMTKQATLGPIDPSVNNPLNPEIPNMQNQRYPVSVEAIKGFIELAKHELAIKDDNALASIFGTLAEKVHPLVLGEVYRAIGQIQMLARKLLRHQVTDEVKIQKIISFLCSESGSHDYTINRREAKEELGLNVETPSDELYKLINDIYLSIKEELELQKNFDPNLDTDIKEKKFLIKRALIESIYGKSNVFISEGLFRKTIVPVNIPVAQLPNFNKIPSAEVVQIQKIYEGWLSI